MLKLEYWYMYCLDINIGIIVLKIEYWYMYLIFLTEILDEGSSDEEEGSGGSESGSEDSEEENEGSY